MTDKEPLDLSELGGAKNGVPQRLDRRLFVSLQVFTGSLETGSLAGALEASNIPSVLYADANDPRGVAVAAMSEDPALFTGDLRALFNEPPFAALSPKRGFAMLGRTYSLGYEPDLEDWLIGRTKRVVLDEAADWAVWYPLRRTGAFAKLPRKEQGRILKEHGVLGRTFGEAGLAKDVRLNCCGLDSNDNDFVIGLVGRDLFPLSALVHRMRPTEQTSTYIQHMGPFFVGRVLWRAKPAVS